jgi:hypothetical protein
MAQPHKKTARKGGLGLKIEVPEPTAQASQSINNQYDSFHIFPRSLARFC